MENSTSFPIYEESQLLSHTQLNNSFNYLDKQIRISRTELIATGIFSGLNWQIAGNAILIEKGTAVSSLGFQIQWASKTFTHTRSVELPKAFLEPVIANDNPVLKKLFADNVGIYQVIKNCTELLESTSTDASKTAITAETFKGKVLMLLFELKVKNANNCDINSCDDKGADGIVDVRPLLITQAQADEFIKNNPINYVELRGKSVCMPRFNIPKTNLSTKTDVLNAYKNVYASGVLGRIVTEFNQLKTRIEPVFNHLEGWAVLANLNNILNQVIAQYQDSLHSQYAYAWLHDIVQTHNELITIGKAYNPKAGASYFPFHVLLGNAEGINFYKYRTGYYPAPHFSQNEIQNYDKACILLKRLIHLLSNFSASTNTIKVTPSGIGSKLLGQQAIPFYYNNQVALSKVWETSNPDNKEPMGYWASSYSDKYCVTEPLKCNLDAHNFYRVEGHIGKNYQDAIRDIEFIKEAYRLPFKVVALNAVSVQGRKLSINSHDFNFEDLEVDYDIARTKVTKIGRDIASWIASRKTDLLTIPTFTNETATSLISLINTVTGLFTDDLGDFLANYEKFKNAFEEINLIYLFQRNCLLRNVYKDTNPGNDFPAEDLIDHLDQLNALFLEDPFSIIYKEAKKRYEDSIKKTLFSTFYQNQEGLENQNGVIKGGTFVLVYTDNEIFADKAKNLGTWDMAIQGIETYRNNLSIPKEDEDKYRAEIKITQAPSAKEQTAIANEARLTGREKCVEEVGTLAFDKMTDTIMTKMPTAYQQEFLVHWLSLKDKLGVLDTIGTDEGLVFADFCLPYICCGEGEGINLILSPKPPVVPKISISNSSICKNSSEKVEITLVPAGIEGVFNDSAVKKENGKYYYDASTKAKGTYPVFFTSTENQKSNELSVVVLEGRKVPIQLSHSESTSSHREILFTIVNFISGERFSVNFGDGTPIQEFDSQTIPHIFPISDTNKTYNIKITSKIAGACPHVTETSIDIKAEPIFKIDPQQYCLNDDKMYCIEVDANFKMAELQNPNSLIFEGDKPCFVPSKQKVGKYNLAYAGKAISIEIKEVNADFEMVNGVDSQRITLKATDSTADTYEWFWIPTGIDSINNELNPQKNKNQINIFRQTIMGLPGDTKQLDITLSVSSKCGKEKVEKKLVYNKEKELFELK